MYYVGIWLSFDLLLIKFIMKLTGAIKNARKNLMRRQNWDDSRLWRQADMNFISTINYCVNLERTTLYFAMNRIFAIPFIKLGSMFLSSIHSGFHKHLYRFWENDVSMSVKAWWAKHCQSNFGCGPVVQSTLSIIITRQSNHIAVLQYHSRLADISSYHTTFSLLADHRVAMTETENIPQLETRETFRLHVMHTLNRLGLWSETWKGCTTHLFWNMFTFLGYCNHINIFIRFWWQGSSNWRACGVDVMRAPEIVIIVSPPHVITWEKNRWLSKNICIFADMSTQTAAA